MPQFHSIEGGWSDKHLEEISALVAIPSWFEPEKEIDERHIAQYIEEALQGCGCEVWRMHVEGERENVIAEKGEGEYVIWIMGHMDMHKPKSHWWDKGSTLEQDGDRMQGAAVDDMKKGLYEMIHLAREIEVPNGLKIMFLFLVDEELDSKGIREVLKHPTFPKPQFVLSPEIPTTAMQDLLENGRRHPIVVTRRGHAKFKGSVQVLREAHGAVGEVPEATNAHREAMNLLFNMVHNERQVITPSQYLGVKGRIMSEAKGFKELGDDTSANLVLQQWAHYLCGHKPMHPLIRKETLSERGSRTVPYDETGTRIAERQEFLISHYSSYPVSLRDELMMFVELFREIEETHKYHSHQIKLLLSPNQEHTQYESYLMDARHPLMGGLKSAVADQHGKEPVEMGGDSTSDMNIIAAAGFLGAEVAGDGWKYHQPDEGASITSSYRNFCAMRQFIAQEIPRVLNDE